MNTPQGNSLTALRAADSFIDAHASALPNATASGKRPLLKTQLAAITTHLTMQNGGKRQARGFSSKITSLRQTLLSDHMSEIARVARADLSESPELTAFRMPRGRVSTENLIAAARGMAHAAAAHVDVFVAAGLAATFIDDLNAAADAVVEALDARKTSAGVGKGATQSLVLQFKGARASLSVLDALVQKDLRNDPATLNEWVAIKRAMRAPSSGATPPAVASPATPPTAATPAATQPSAQPTTQEVRAA